MTGSACKCTYNGGSTWEDNCKCGVAPVPTPAPEPCVQDPHCQMTGSACKCTYNGGSTWEDNCKCGVGPALTSALVSGTEHAADQAWNFRNETVKTFAQAGASCQPDPHCQMTGSECKCTYNGGMLGAAHQRGRQRRPDAALAIVLPRRTTIVGTLARRAGHLAMRALHTRLRRGRGRRRDAALAIVLPRRAAVVSALARRAGHLAMRVLHTRLRRGCRRRRDAALAIVLPRRAGHLAMRVRLARIACLGERLDGFV